MIRTLSAAIMPLVFLLMIGYGLMRHVSVFEAFMDGAKSGMKSLFAVLPALVGLLAAISMLRASGALDCFTRLLAPAASWLGIPSELMPLALLRPVSGSGTLALVNDLLNSAGPDSMVGRMASVIMGSTETTFYTLAVYYGAVHIKSTRHTLPAALLADFAGLLGGVYICRLFFR